MKNKPKCLKTFGTWETLGFPLSPIGVFYIFEFISELLKEKCIIFTDTYC